MRLRRGTGEPTATGVNWLAAAQTIYHDAGPQHVSPKEIKKPGLPGFSFIGVKCECYAAAY
ncbi:MAG: hypothetical protein KA314_01445 [Chloroflexi bacterium]|nr:hypothetical protein [Chloroflexota bacterium]MBP8054472.1 hypothetical protein [Chloroflexota bacterium]